MKRERVYVEASICARPMFEKLGFTILSENQVDLGGVKLMNYLMERRSI
jgi:putative acetyltransferase